MPWSVKENYKDCKGFAVVKDDDGSIVTCHGQDKGKADAHKKALYANYKMETEQERILLEGVGPALVAVAVTAKPHLRQRGKEIRMVEIDGKAIVEVPLYKKGIYRHKTGALVFNDPFVSRMVENHQAKVTDYNVHLDFRHNDSQGALAFLDPDDGGWLEMKADGWLYAYGPPTDDKAVEIINSRKWRYASPEFAPNYESNFVQKLSADDLTEIQIEQLITMEDTPMPKNLTLGTKVIQLELEDAQINQIEAAYKEVQDMVAKLEAKVVELSPKTEPELPEAYRVRLKQLEAQNRQLEQDRMAERVNITMERARAHRDEKGRGHDKVFMDLAEAGLRLSGYEQDTTVIKLENSESVGDVVNFYRRLITHMLEKCPGTVPASGKTQADEYRLESGSNGHFTPEEFEAAVNSFWD